MAKDGLKLQSQISGMAGEFLTVGKLFKLGLQASVTLGNAKSVDVLAFNPRTRRSFNVQVKTCRQKNCFPIKKENIARDDIYVFVFLNEMDEQENFYILEGKEILRNIDKYFGSSYKRSRPSSMPGINYGPLKEFENNWDIFTKGQD
jgi:transposase-like protein